MTKRSTSSLGGNKLILKKLVHQLACNNSTIRLRTIKNIKKYISKLKGNIPELELLHLWKGLHYALWMTDKLLFQELIAEEISSLLFCFKQSELMFKFFGAYLNLQIHEWLLIDQLRIDKFMMLVRLMFSKLFKSLKEDLWNTKSVILLNDMVYKFLMGDDSPNSLIYHVVQLFLPEIEKQQFTKEVISSCIMTFAKVFSRTKNKYLAVEIKKCILMNLLSSDSKFMIDKIKLSEFLLKLVNKKSCKNKNIVFGYIKLLKNQAIQPVEESFKKQVNHEKINNDFMNEDQVEEAVNRWQKLDAKLRKKMLESSKKRKKNLVEMDENDESEDDDVMVNDKETDDEETDDDQYDDIDDMVEDAGYALSSVVDSDENIEMTKCEEPILKNKRRRSLNWMEDVGESGTCDVNATHTSMLVVIDSSNHVKKRKKTIGKKHKLKSPVVIPKKKKYEISFEYDDVSLNGQITSPLLENKSSLLNPKHTKRVKFSSNNHSKEFHKNLTPKFDPSLLPKKSAMKFSPKLNKTF